MWGYVDGKWQVYNPSQPDFSDLESFKSGLGYWIKTKEACLLTYPYKEENKTFPTDDEYLSNNNDAVTIVNEDGYDIEIVDREIIIYLTDEATGSQLY